MKESDLYGTYSLLEKLSATFKYEADEFIRNGGTEGQEYAKLFDKFSKTNKKMMEILDEIYRRVVESD